MSATEINSQTNPIDGKRFPWGAITQVHEIGEYQVLEYRPDGVPEPMFHLYIDGRDTSHGFYTLDSALVYAIARKYDGNNTMAHTYFMRAIGAKSEDDS